MGDTAHRRLALVSGFWIFTILFGAVIFVDNDQTIEGVRFAQTCSAASYSSAHRIEEFYNIPWHTVSPSSQWCHSGARPTPFPQPAPSRGHQAIGHYEPVAMRCLQAQEQAVGQLLRPMWRLLVGGCIAPGLRLVAATDSNASMAASSGKLGGLGQQPKTLQVATWQATAVSETAATPYDAALTTYAIDSAASQGQGTPGSTSSPSSCFGFAAQEPRRPAHRDTLIQHARAQKEVPASLQTLLDQHLQEDARHQTKRHHALVKQQQVARAQLRKLKDEKVTYEASWENYLLQLTQALEKQMAERAATIQTFAESEVAWSSQLEQASIELARLAKEGAEAPLGEHVLIDPFEEAATAQSARAQAAQRTADAEARSKQLQEALQQARAAALENLQSLSKERESSRTGRSQTRTMPFRCILPKTSTSSSRCCPRSRRSRRCSPLNRPMVQASANPRAHSAQVPGRT